MRSLKNLVESVVGDESEEFALWAFGPNFLTLNADKGTAKGGFFHSWNELHGDKMLLNGSSHPAKDVRKMIQIWMKHKDEKRCFLGQDK